jgi:hypothetical protein
MSAIEDSMDAGIVSGRVEYPDGGYAYFGEHAPGPVVSVRFPDGGLAEFRPGGDWPRNARVRYAGLMVKDLSLEVDANVDHEGKVWSSSVWKTDVAGADGGSDIPVKIRESAEALCRRRAREAREALRLPGRP